MYDMNVDIFFYTAEAANIVSTEAIPPLADVEAGGASYISDCLIQPEVGKLSCSYLFDTGNIVLASWSVSSSVLAAS